MFCKDNQALIQQLEEIDNGVVVILACEKGFDFSKIQPHLKNKKIPVVGAFFPGIIAQEELHYSGYLLLHFESSCEVHVLDSKEAELDSLELDMKSGTGFVLLDGLADGNQEFLNKIFYRFSHSFKFVGSGAGSLELVQKACIFDKDGIYQNKAIVVFIENNVGIGIKHGYDRIAGPIIATQTDDSRIAELNWENAFDVYASILKDEVAGLDISKDSFFDVSKGYPLGISYKGYEDIVRDPISCNPDGVINCIDDIPENAALYVLRGESQKLINAAKESCEEAMSLEDKDPTHCLLSFQWS